MWIADVRKPSVVVSPGWNTVSPLCVHPGLDLTFVFPSPTIDLREEFTKWVKSQLVTGPPPVILRWDSCGHSRLCIPKNPWQQDLHRAIFPQVESRPSVGFLIRLEALYLLLPQRKGHIFVPSVLCDRLSWNHIIPFPASLTAPRKCWHVLPLMCGVDKHHWSLMQFSISHHKWPQTDMSKVSDYFQISKYWYPHNEISWEWVF